MDSLRLACNNIIRRTNRYTFDDHKIAICLHTWFLGRYVKRTCREHSPIIASRIIEFLWPGISTPCERKSREDPHLGNAISWCTRPIKQISLTAELRRRVHGDRLNRDVKLVLGGYHAISSVLWLRTWREREKRREEERKKRPLAILARGEIDCAVGGASRGTSTISAREGCCASLEFIISALIGYNLPCNDHACPLPKLYFFKWNRFNEAISFRVHANKVSF